MSIADTGQEFVSFRLPSEMSAIRVATFGGPDVIRAERLPLPAFADDEVLVKIAAAGVGPWDGWIRGGRSVLPQPLPLTLGSDIAGIVVARGKAATKFKQGERVYGVTNKRFTGGYAQYAACRADMLAGTPDCLSDIAAASAPVVTVTAWQMLFDRARLDASQSVLIHGAAGNVGRYAVQMARAAKLHVIATGFDDAREQLVALGAHEVVGADLQSDAKVDAVIDLVGGSTQVELFKFLRRGGRLVSAVSSPDQRLASEHGVSAEFMLVDVNTADLVKVSSMFEQESIRPWVGTVLPLAQARRAHEMLEGKVPAPPGKIVLQISH